MKTEISYNNKKEIYNEHLNTLSNVKLTSREIDIIACILHNRGEKKIAALLSISPRTVGTHIRNVMLKLGHSSKEHIIDFVENSGKLLFIRLYYLHILIHNSFEKQLIKISKTINKQEVICTVNCQSISMQEQNKIDQLTEHLKLANIILKETDKIPADVKNNFYVLTNQSPQNLVDYTVLVLNKDIFFKDDVNQYLDFSKEDYYLTVFKLLKKVINHTSLEENIQEFEKEYHIIKNSWIGENTEVKVLSKPFLFKPKFTMQNSFLIVILIIFITLLAIWFVGQYVNNFDKTTNLSIISYDLPLPHQNILLKRTSLLEKIDKKLSGKDGIQTIVLVGAAGSGKTTIAYQYARNQNQKSSLLWKINAETRDSLIGSIKQLAYSICKTEKENHELTIILQTKDESERERKLFEFLKIRVKNYPNWLIIYNNVGTFKDIKEYFPHDSKVWGNGKIIITTRDSNITHNKYINPENVIQVGELTKEEKLELFNKVVNECTDCSDGVKLTNTEFLEKLPPFPLDISLAANYIKVEKLSYGKYLMDLAEQKEEFISNQKTILNDIGEYNQTRYDIVTLSIKQLINIHPDFKDLLLFISLIDFENIPKDLLVAYKDEITISKFIHELKKFSLIIEQLPPTNTSTATFTIHQTTQQVILAYLTMLLNLDQNAVQLKDISIVLENYMSNELKILNSFKMSLLVTHTEMFLEHPKLVNEIILADLGMKVGIFHFHMANYKKAKEYFEQTLIVYQKKYGKDNIRTAKVLVRLGSVYRNIGNYKKAKEYFEQAHVVYEKVYGKDDIKTIEVYTYLGSIYRNIGDYKKATQLLELALANYEKNYGRDNIETARVLAYLGSTYKNTGDYKKAKDYLDQALEMYKKYYGEDHVQTAWTSGRLGNVYKSIGDYDKSKQLLEQALIVYKKHHGENCIETAWTLSHLGSVNTDLKDNILAQNNINQSLNIYKNHLEDNHVTIAWARFNLGNFNLNIGNFDLAQKLLEQALIIYRVNYGNNHIQTAGVLNCLGKAYLLRNNIKIAKNLVNQALEIFKHNDHPDYYIALENLTEIYLKKSQQAKNKGDIQQSQFLKQQSISYLKNALEIVKTHFPENSHHTMRIQSRLEDLEKE